MAAQPTESILQGVAATCTVTLRDYLGDPADAGGTVTCTITRAAGTVIATGRSTSNPTGTGTYTVALTAAETASLDLLTLSWLDAGTARATTRVEVAGGVYMGLAELKEREPGVARNRTDAQVRKALREAVEECERCCGNAWVPRYAYEAFTVRSDGSVVLPTPLVRSVRSAADTDGNAVTLTDVEAFDTGKVTGLAGSGLLTIGWEHGADEPPEEIRAMVARRARYRLGLPSSPEQDRSARFVVQDGVTIAFANAGPFKTGDDEVDSVYARLGWRVPGIA